MLQRKGYNIKWEPYIRTVEGLLKTDFVATMGRLALVMDAHIVSDNVDMMAMCEAKIWKYSYNPGIDAALSVTALSS